MSAKHDGLDGPADVRHECVESVLVVHVVPVDPNPGEDAEQPTQHGDRCRTGRCGLVGGNARLNPGETFGNVAASRDIHEHRAYKISQRRCAVRTATGDRHSDGNWID
jgi:hypothetical protein